jgi:predicted acylesterase/phospholipase RssA
VNFDTARLAEHRRPFDRLERRVVQLFLKQPEAVPPKLLDGLRYVISFARLTKVWNVDGHEVDVQGLLSPFARGLRDTLEPRLESATDLWDVVRILPELVQLTRTARASLLDHLEIDRDSLELEVTTRRLVVVSGGGGGAGYGYMGCYQELDRHDLVPNLMVGTSVGSLTSLFRARRLHYDEAPIISATRTLTWSYVLRALESESRYGIPAALRMYLRAALGSLFQGRDGTPLWMSHLDIPTYIVATGITVDALKHDLGHYEHFLDRDLRRGSARERIRGVARTMTVLREFMARPDALVEIALGRADGTQDFDVLDASGFSMAVPGVLHYDVLRKDDRMCRMLDDLYADYGITRLGEGGLTSNVPARVGWESVAHGMHGVHQPFVLALDCFAPNARRPLWVPLQQLVRAANVDRDRRYADLYLPLPRTLSPMNVVPAIKDAQKATRWGRDTMKLHMPFITTMMRPIEVLMDQAPS